MKNMSELPHSQFDSENNLTVLVIDTDVNLMNWMEHVIGIPKVLFDK